MIRLPMNVKCKKGKGNRKGQAILFAVVGVTIALAIGVTVASRNLSSISRISRSDTSERAFAAAEGGIEKLLVLSGSELDTIAGLTTDSCNLVGGSPISDGCNIKYPKIAGDPIESTADLKVEKYSYNETYETTPYLALDINNGDLAEVNLRSSSGTKYTGTLTLCWDNDDAAIYYSFNNYYGSCDVRKGALRSSDSVGVFPNVINTSDDGFTNVSTGANGFARCYNFDLTSTQYDSLRFRVLYERTLVGIFATNLTDQGYKLISLGKLSGQNEIVKKVVAYRSYPFMSSIFDAAIFSATGQIN